MKIFLTLALSALAALQIQAQSSDLPEILVPSANTRAEANRLGFRALKLLPRGMFEAKEPSYTDQENPLGIRGGGAYFSFTTGSHSYNKIPQIQLGRDSFSVGFAGLHYGFVKDLGTIPLSDVTEETNGLIFLSHYKPPHFIPEIRAEQYKREIVANGVSYSDHAHAVVGHTYALRAISYDLADVLVAFTLASRNDDGSAELIWRHLKTFEKPVPWYFTDTEMNEKLVAILAEAGFTGIAGSVKDNVIALDGKASQRTVDYLLRRLHPLRSPQIINRIKIIDKAPVAN